MLHLFDHPADSSRVPDWLSVYLSFSANTIYGIEADRVIVYVVAPLIERLRQKRLIARQFFIRYAEHMPHIRLRLQPHDRAGALAAVSLVDDYLAKQFPNATRDSFRSPRTDRPRGEGEIIDVSWVPYEPETDRYGGPEALSVAEDFFADSSDASISLLQSMLQSGKDRLGPTLLQMLVLSFAFSASAPVVAELTRHFSRAYLPALAGRSGSTPDSYDQAFIEAYARQSRYLAAYITEASSRLEQGSSLGAELDRFGDAVRNRARELRDVVATGSVRVNGRTCNTWEEATTAIAPSYLHMLCNRNGVTMTQEAYLASLISRSVADTLNGVCGEGVL